MFLTPYFVQENNQFHFTRAQASNFAKGIAGDFNPIHDEDNSRFCVPGDLLFAVMLQQEGISRSMEFTFSGMVTEGTELHINHESEENKAVVMRTIRFTLACTVRVKTVTMPSLSKK
ncbi:hypothetical protein JCM19232_2427 [Vibrio ishigakensis]|uniref:MaoC-like domain-containing protein n=1 Tax=Vibrio ishigakensis TaxID=1481914 RepID=A0A0B8PFR8_9VIBR|nr:hypothetical protein JCM19232_2427 [Vibrio ishigakensis]